MIILRVFSKKRQITISKSSNYVRTASFIARTALPVKKLKILIDSMNSAQRIVRPEFIDMSIVVFYEINVKRAHTRADEQSRKSLRAICIKIVLVSLQYLVMFEIVFGRTK